MHGEKGGGKTGEGGGRGTKAKVQAKRLIMLQQKRVRVAGLLLYTLPFVRAHSYCASINEVIKKALVNSTGKLSLGEGPAQTSRAGLGFAARGLGSRHHDFVAEMRFGLLLCRIAIKSRNTKNNESRLHVFHSHSSASCVSKHVSKEMGFDTREKEAKPRMSTFH